MFNLTFIAYRVPDKPSGLEGVNKQTERAVIFMACTCELSADIQGQGEICDPDTADTIYENCAHIKWSPETARSHVTTTNSHNCGGF